MTMFHHDVPQIGNKVIDSKIRLVIYNDKPIFQIDYIIKYENEKINWLEGICGIKEGELNNEYQRRNYLLLYKIANDSNSQQYKSNEEINTYYFPLDIFNDMMKKYSHQ